METPKEYHYVYYSYEEYGRGYFGSRTCKCLPEKDVKYFGSSKDKTFKPTQKIILKSDYATRKEAYSDEIILQKYYKVVDNPHFANKAYQTSTKFYYIHPFDKISKFGKVQGKINYQNGVGIHALTSEQKGQVGKIGGKRGTQKCKELGVGIYSLTLEDRIKYGKIGGENGAKKCKELGVGIYALTPEQRRENVVKGGKASAKIINAQKWECCETGYVSTAAGVVSYQKGKGIDTSKNNRRRIA